MAFGGVATGIINAMEAATVAGIASIRGSISMPMATAPSTGRKVAADAVFDVISVENITVDRFNNFYLFTIKADGFLHHQIRNMISTIIAVGRAKINPDYIETLFLKKNRSLTPATFSPNGLYLTNIKYDKVWGLPDSLNTLNIFKMVT